MDPRCGARRIALWGFARFLQWLLAIVKTVAAAEPNIWTAAPMPEAALTRVGARPSSGQLYARVAAGLRDLIVSYLTRPASRRLAPTTATI
jgi:hypothetical protein